jgi:hypothetical protein
MTREFITEDGDAVDGTTRLEVGLDILGRRTIVDLYGAGGYEEPRAIQG